MCGQLGAFGTNSFDVLVDDEKYIKEAQRIAVERGDVLENLMRGPNQSLSPSQSLNRSRKVLQSLNLSRNRSQNQNQSLVLQNIAGIILHCCVYSIVLWLLLIKILDTDDNRDVTRHSSLI